MKTVTINGNKIAEVDLQYYNDRPSPNFSPERNKAVIAGTIKKYKAMRKQKLKEYHDKVQERAEAAASFLKHRDMGKSTRIEDYFGKQELMNLRAEKLLMKLLDKRNKIYSVGEKN